jgi:hypothetical protein
MVFQIPPAFLANGYAHCTLKGHKYKFSQFPQSYVETCTSFYVFSGLRWLTGWVGYSTPTQSPRYLSASHRPTPPPRHHYLQHTIGIECTSWFGAVCHLWRASVPFLNKVKLLIFCVNVRSQLTPA